MWPSNVPDYKRNVTAVSSRLNETPFQQVWSEGRNLPLEEVYALARK